MTEAGHIRILTEDREPFAKLHQSVIEDHRISVGARFLYAVLHRLGWREGWTGLPGYSGQAGMAEYLGISRASVTRYLSELSRAGYITVHHRGLGLPADIDLLPLPTGSANQAASD